MTAQLPAFPPPRVERRPGRGSPRPAPVDVPPCAAVVPWLDGPARTARCDERVVPGTRWCTEHLISASSSARAAAAVVAEFADAIGVGPGVPVDADVPDGTGARWSGGAARALRAKKGGGADADVPGLVVGDPTFGTPAVGALPDASAAGTRT